MPLYEYECDQCGVFTALRKMSDSSLPAECTDCGATSPRILSVPKLAIMSKLQRSAYERNEKSAHEPKSGRRSSCGCTGTHVCKSTDKQAKQVDPEHAKPALQMQTKKTARPWMVGH